MRVVPVEEQADFSLRGHTLVLPGVGGVAHLGELAVDAVVTTFGLSRVAIVQSRHVLPVAMASAWKAPEQQSGRLALTTAAELYQSAEAPGLTVLQLRSLVSAGCRRAFAKELWSWASAAGVAQILLLAPCAAFVKVDADLDATTELRYLHFGADSDAPLAELGLTSNILPLGHSLPEDDDALAEEVSSLPKNLRATQRMLRGSGVAKMFLLEAAEALADNLKREGDAASEGAPGVLCLLGFSSEGVDWRTTEQLTRAACAVLASKLKRSPPEIRFPPSWQLEAARPVQYIFG